MRAARIILMDSCMRNRISLVPSQNLVRASGSAFPVRTRIREWQFPVANGKIIAADVDVRIGNGGDQCRQRNRVRRAFGCWPNFSQPLPAFDNA
jgi:hypothetical protein